MNSTLNINDRQLLSAIANYKVLTVKQLSIISERSGQVVRRRMRVLAKEGVLGTRMEGYGGGRGRPEDLLFFTERGATLLDKDEISHASLAVGNTGDHIPIDHLLLVNWFRIHLLQMERLIPELSVRYSRPESLTDTFDNGRGLTRSEEKDGREDLSDFIPDVVFAITRNGDDPKTLLFFLEVDMGTETIATTDRHHKDLRQKILNYQTLFRTGQYKRYQAVFNSKLNGFRLLFLTNSNSRSITLCRLVREMPPSDFIWLVDQEKMFSHGVSAKIWARGGRHEDPPQSILGPWLARELTVMDSQE